MILNSKDHKPRIKRLPRHSGTVYRMTPEYISRYSPETWALLSSTYWGLPTVSKKRKDPFEKKVNAILLGAGLPIRELEYPITFNYRGFYETVNYRIIPRMYKNPKLTAWCIDIMNASAEFTKMTERISYVNPLSSIYYFSKCDLSNQLQIKDLFYNIKSNAKTIDLVTLMGVSDYLEPSLLFQLLILVIKNLAPKKFFFRQVGLSDFGEKYYPKTYQQMIKSEFEETVRFFNKKNARLIKPALTEKEFVQVCHKIPVSSETKVRYSLHPQYPCTYIHPLYIVGLFKHFGYNWLTAEQWLQREKPLSILLSFETNN